MVAALAMREVTKSFGPVEVIKGVNLEIEPNELVVVAGPRQSGKSTLLSLISGAKKITSGELMIGDEIVNDIPPKDRDIAMVFQNYALYPHMTVFQNISFGLRLKKCPTPEVIARVEAAARFLDIVNLLDLRPRQLSGGQRQRVALARAIVRHPKVFLFDEPFSNLDANLRAQMRNHVKELCHGLNGTAIYATNDLTEAMTIADRIAVLAAGNVQQFGRPDELYQHPRNKFVAGFIGSGTMNFLPCAVESASGRNVSLRLDSGVALTLQTSGTPSGLRPTEIGIRPEHLRIDGIGDAMFEGQIIDINHFGEEDYLHVNIGRPEPLVVIADAATPMRLGEHARIGLPAAAGYMFTADGSCLTRERFPTPRKLDDQLISQPVESRRNDKGTEPSTRSVDKVGPAQTNETAHAGRRLNAWVDDASPQQGRPFTVLVNVGSPRGRGLADAPFIEPDFGALAAIELLISLSGLEADIEPGEQRVLLPKTGATETISFKVSMDKAGSQVLSIKVYLAKQMILLQHLSFSMVIRPEDTLEAA
jgi:ABC-type sugar transport system ATPase subunit